MSTGEDRIREDPDAGGLEYLKQTKTILLTTFRRDGTPVATPVSIAFDGDRGFFRTWQRPGRGHRLGAAE